MMNFTGIKMKKAFLVSVLCMILSGCQMNVSDEEASLKGSLSEKFLIGTALNTNQIEGSDSLAIDVVKKHFNAIVAENCMKLERLQPKEGRFNFEIADKFVRFGEENELFVSGHTLVWHSQVPNWFFVDSTGNEVSRQELIVRMKNHIQTVVGRYKGCVKGWDVVNEAIESDGSYRKTMFYNIIGEDYISMAFQFAHEADPDAELYYNDYGMADSAKRVGVVRMIQKLKQQGVRIDGVGMQSHISLDHPSMEEFEKSIIAFSQAGVKVMITELDLTVLPLPDRNIGAEVSASYGYQQQMNPYHTGLPDTVNALFEKRYLDLFDVLFKHQDVITRVTFWGVNDAQSWRNNWPIKGRIDYPLLFDRNSQPKPLVDKIIEESNEL